MGADVSAVVGASVTSGFSAMACALGAVRLGALGRATTGVATARRAMVVAADALLLTAAGAVFADSRGRT